MPVQPADRPPREISPDQIARFSDILLHYPSLLSRVRDLEAQLKQARESAISDHVRGPIRHLVTLMSDSRPEYEIAAAWEELFPMLLTLLEANRLDHLLEAPHLTEDDLEQAQLAWADGIRKWRETEGLAKAQILAAPCDHSVLRRWLLSSDPQSYAAAYRPETVYLLTAVIRTRAAGLESRLNGLDSSLTSGLLIADPLVCESPSAASPSDTLRIEEWCAMITAALGSGARRVLGCAAQLIPISQSAAEPGPWLAFDLCTSRQDIRVYRAGGEMPEADILSVRLLRRGSMLTGQVFGSILRLVEVDQKDLWEIKIEDPVSRSTEAFYLSDRQLRTMKLELFRDSDHSGALAVEILSSLMPTNSEDVLTRAMDGVPAAASEGEVELMKLAQHLCLLRSNACNRQLLDLCTLGTIRLYR